MEWKRFVYVMCLRIRKDLVLLSTFPFLDHGVHLSIVMRVMFTFRNVYHVHALTLFALLSPEVTSQMHTYIKRYDFLDAWMTCPHVDNPRTW